MSGYCFLKSVGLPFKSKCGHNQQHINQLKPSTPYTIHLPVHKQGKPLVAEPDAPLLHLPLAFTKLSVQSTKYIQLAEQFIAGSDWYLLVWQWHCQKKAMVKIEMHQSLLQMILSLKNTINITIDKSNFSWPVNQYRIASMSKGMYTLDVEQGLTVMAILSPPSSLLEVTKHPAITKNQSPSNVFLSLPEAAITPHIRTILRKLKQIDPLKNQLTAKIFNSMIALLAAYDKTLRNYDTPTYVNYSQVTALKVKQFLLENLQEPGIGNMQHLCKKFFISEKTLRKAFTILTGKSVAQFLKQRRLDKALTLLKTSAAPIATIAYEVGYTEPNNFVRDFKIRYGYTPTAQRK